MLWRRVNRRRRIRRRNRIKHRKNYVLLYEVFPFFFFPFQIHTLELVWIYTHFWDAHPFEGIDFLSLETTMKSTKFLILQEVLIKSDFIKNFAIWILRMSAARSAENYLGTDSISSEKLPNCGDAPLCVIFKVKVLYGTKSWSVTW